MQRLLIGLGSLVFLLVTAILVVPFFLPKDQIKQQVVAQVDNRFGWRLRLDGPVSLSLFPGFRLIAEDIGISGEAGADGLEFARAQRMEFGLAWPGLLSGNIQLTGLLLDEPDIVLEIDPSGATSWEPRRELGSPAPAQTEVPGDSGTAATDPNAPVGNAPGDTSTAGYLKSIGVDSFVITNGMLTYKDARSDTAITINDFALDLKAPDLAGDVQLSSSFILQDIPLAVAGTVANPLALASGEQVPINLSVSSGENTIIVSGTGGAQPPRADVDLDASGPSLKALAALAGQTLGAEPGAFLLEAKVSASEAAVSVADLNLALGDLSLGGAADADLLGLVPEISGRLVLKDGSIADLLLLAGQDLPASGQLSADLAFETVGVTGSALLAGLDLNGRISVVDGEIGGLGLADAVGGDPEADRITNLSLDVELKGLDEVLSTSGALTWRGEGFSLTGEADTARLLAAEAGAVSGTLKGNRFSLGFDGQAKVSGEVDGAVRLQTADLRGLMAWMGQPIASGGGLRTFNASGIFGFHDQTISFEETRFLLDETSGEANGKVVLGDKPAVTARLALRELVLDPYLTGDGGPSAAGGASSAAPAATSGGGSGSTPARPASGWSSAPIDFSGLRAVDVDFQLTSQEIRWDKITIGESALSAQIKGGVLSADLQRLSLYGGSGRGTVRLDGTASVPAIAARFSLSGVDAYPMLRDAADFNWIEGTASVNLDVTANGASEQALIGNLNGTAGFEFADGAVRGINIPQMVRGLSVETLLGWQSNPAAKTDFSSLSASFNIASGVAATDDLSLIGPLVRMTGRGTTDMPAQSLSWRVEPRIVASLQGQGQVQGQAPIPLRKGEGGKMAGLGVPVVIDGPWADPRIYPDIAGILENPEAAYQQLEQLGGELLSVLKGDAPAPENLVDTANEVLSRATGGTTQIDVQKVIDGDVNDEDVLKAVEEGFGLPSGLLGNVFGGNKPNQ